MFTCIRFDRKISFDTYQEAFDWCMKRSWANELWQIVK